MLRVVLAVVHPGEGGGSSGLGGIPENVLGLAVFREDEGLRLRVSVRARHPPLLRAETREWRRRARGPGQRRPQNRSSGHASRCLIENRSVGVEKDGVSGFREQENQMSSSGSQYLSKKKT